MVTTDQTRVRNAVGHQPKTLAEIARVTQLDGKRVRVAVEKLVAGGRLLRRDGGYVKAGRRHHGPPC